MKLKIAIALLAGMGVGAATIQALHAQSKPPAYVITEFEVTDQEAAKEFGAKVAEAVKVSGGRYLVRGGGQVVALDGEAPKRVVVQVFDNADQARTFYSSAAWKQLTPLREKALKQRSYIAEGVN